MRHPLRLSWLLLVSTFTNVALGKYVKKYPYLYSTSDNPNAGAPIIEHLSPEYRGLPQDTIDEPSFLSDTDPGYRIVEYYLSWCNTCKSYAPVYRSFITKLNQIVSNNVTIAGYAVSCSPNRVLCKHQTVRGFPKIRLYKPNSSDYIELKHHMDIYQPLLILEQLGLHTQGVEDFELEQPSSSSLSATTAGIPTSIHSYLSRFFVSQNTPPPRRTRSHLIQDVQLSFHYAMRHEIYRSDTLDDTQKEILKQWLKLLHDTLPTFLGLTDLLRDLYLNFIYIQNSEDYLTAVLDEYPPQQPVWSDSCSKGQNNDDEGYTCGLWELLHVLTVAVVQRNAASFDDDGLLPTLPVAVTIRNYLSQFFGCQECAQNFVTTFDACGYNSCVRLSNKTSHVEVDWMQLPLWLHDTHNGVNVRLLEEGGAAGRTKVTTTTKTPPPPISNNTELYPSKPDCPLCYRAKDATKIDNDNEDGSSSSDVVWDPASVYQFLKLEYGVRDLSSPDFARRLATSVKEEEEEKKRNKRIGVAHSSSLILVLVSGGAYYWVVHQYCFGRRAVVYKEKVG